MRFVKRGEARLAGCASSATGRPWRSPRVPWSGSRVPLGTPGSRTLVSPSSGVVAEAPRPRVYEDQRCGDRSPRRAVDDKQDAPGRCSRNCWQGGKSSIYRLTGRHWRSPHTSLCAVEYIPGHPGGIELG